jgi:hypothetical protein
MQEWRDGQQTCGLGFQVEGKKRIMNI